MASLTWSKFDMIWLRSPILASRVDNNIIWKNMADDPFLITFHSGDIG